MLRSGLLWLSDHQGLFDFIRGNGFARKMASRFVAGETLDSAVEAVRVLNGRGIAASLDLLGESVTNEGEAARARNEVIRIIERIAATGVDSNVSIKLTQFGLDLDEGLCGENVRAALEAAKRLGVFVRVDMESAEFTERTLRLFGKVLQPEFGDLVGVVIQSYLRRSAEDVERLIGLGARVRLCKGAYAESPRVAYPDKRDVDRSYARLAERLLSEGNYPGIATHDEKLIVHVERYAAANGIAPERFEFQMLYGVRRDLQQALREKGYNMRVYVPFGTQWYPYLMRRLAERPANLAFMVGSVVREAFAGR